MRIALISSLYEPYVMGGSEWSTRELAEGLANRGHQVLVVSLVPPGFGDRSVAQEQIAGVTVRRLESAGVKTIFPGVPRGGWLQRRSHQIAEWCRIPAARKLARVLGSFQPDVVHTALVAGFGARVWKVGRRYPLLHTIRDYYLICARTAAFRDGHACISHCTGCRVMKTPMRWAVSDADLIAGVSRDVLRRHVEWGVVSPSMPTEVVYDRPVLELPDTRAGVGSGRVLGCIGRIGDFKGTHVLLAAMAMIDDPDVRLVFAGDGPPDDLARLRSAAERDPRISYSGEQDAAEFMSSVDVVLAPAQLYEPFGRTAYEGALAGKHVLVSGRGGLPEVIENYPNGYVVENPSEPAAWAAAIKDVIGVAPDSSPWIGHPDPVDRYESIYRSLVDARRQTADQRLAGIRNKPPV
jgi:glycosyltransferase involved in cell wall biosynthesis